MELKIPEIQQLAEKIEILAEKIDTASYKAEWYNDKQCWELKGGMSLSTYRTNRYYQCKGGKPDATIGGRKVWNRMSVMEWVKVKDVDLPDYHARYKTGATKKQ